MGPFCFWGIQSLHIHSVTKGVLSYVGMRGHATSRLCSMLKYQNSYEFIHNLKNSNNMQECTG